MRTIEPPCSPARTIMSPPRMALTSSTLFDGNSARASTSATDAARHERLRGRAERRVGALARREEPLLALLLVIFELLLHQIAEAEIGRGRRQGEILCAAIAGSHLQ